jgi:hypothetical protein
MAQGHCEPPETRANVLPPSWIFSDEEIAATGATVWRSSLGPSGVAPAFYSGSPELARTVNLVRFSAAGGLPSPAKRCCGRTDETRDLLGGIADFAE